MRLRFPKPPKREPSQPKPLKRGKRPNRRVHVKRMSMRRGQQLIEDAEWSASVRAAHNHECWACTSPGLDAHHIFGKKAHPRLRYDIENGVALCRTHHQRWHATPVWWRKLFSRVFPLRWDRLQKKARRESRLA